MQQLSIEQLGCAAGREEQSYEELSDKQIITLKLTVIARLSKGSVSHLSIRGRVM